jgi:hypothetical protein
MASGYHSDGELELMSVHSTSPLGEARPRRMRRLPSRLRDGAYDLGLLAENGSSSAEDSVPHNVV